MLEAREGRALCAAERRSASIVEAEREEGDTSGLRRADCPWKRAVSGGLANGSPIRAIALALRFPRATACAAMLVTAISGAGALQYRDLVAERTSGHARIVHTIASRNAARGPVFDIVAAQWSFAGTNDVCARRAWRFHEADAPLASAGRCAAEARATAA